MSAYHNENMEKFGHGLNLKRLYTGAAVVTIGTRKALDASAVIDGADSLPFLFSNRSQRLNSAIVKGIQVVRISSRKAISYTIGAIFALLLSAPAFALTSTTPVVPEVKAPVVYHTITECVQLNIENCRISPTLTLVKKSTKK